MAFFKFRKGGDEHPTPAAATESVEAIRTRARHRLIGASVLVLLGVIGFPLLFDSQPRPISVDIPIEIPDRNTVKPLSSASPIKPAVAVAVEADAGKPVDMGTGATPSTVLPAQTPAPAAPSATASRATAGAVATLPSPSEPAVAKVVPKPEPQEDNTKSVAKPSTAPSADKTAQRTDDGAKAQALLEGKEPELPASASASASAPANSGRFVVQIGAFSDAAKAHEARMKLERAGLKTYTQVVQPKEGKRIRVRVGPYESKGEADKVADKIKKLDLPTAILEL